MSLSVNVGLLHPWKKSLESLWTQNSTAGVGDEQQLKIKGQITIKGYELCKVLGKIKGILSPPIRLKKERTSAKLYFPCVVTCLLISLFIHSVVLFVKFYNKFASSLASFRIGRDRECSFRFLKWRWYSFSLIVYKISGECICIMHIVKSLFC